MDINIEEFEREPDVEIIKKAKVASLKALATHYGISFDKKAYRSVLIRTITEALIESEIIPPEALQSLDLIDGADLQLRKMKVEAEISLKRDLEFKRLEAEHELRLRELELREKFGPRPARDFDVAKNVRLVPQFTGIDVENYFLSFEKIAERLEWPDKFWTMLLQSVFVGRASEVYSTLSKEQSEDYNFVKTAVLRAYEQVPEAYRQKFRSSRRPSGQRYVEFARGKEMDFDRWYRSLKVEKDFNPLKEDVLMEEFKRSIGGEVRTYLDDQKVKNVQSAAVLADEYELTHKT